MQAALSPLCESRGCPPHPNGLASEWHAYRPNCSQWVRTVCWKLKRKFLEASLLVLWENTQKIKSSFGHWCMEIKHLKVCSSLAIYQGRSHSRRPRVRTQVFFSYDSATESELKSMFSLAFLLYHFHTEFKVLVVGWTMWPSGKTPA